MQIYSMITNAIRVEELKLRPLGDKESCSVHFRSGDATFVVTRARTDRPDVGSERIYTADDSLVYASGRTVRG